MSRDNDERFEERLSGHSNPDSLDEIETEEEWDVTIETQTAFDIIADRIYSGKEAGIREPITNSLTAIYRSVDEGYLDSKDDGIVVIELSDDGGSLTLRIRDNGMGVCREEIDTISSIGKTTVGDINPEKIGKFGMGFFSLWMLAGLENGSFIMHTNARGVDEDPVSGFWIREKFLVPENDIAGGFDQDEYGTEFVIHLDQSIDKSEIEEWVEKYAEWTRVPILFREKDQSGITEEEYPPKYLADRYKSVEEGEIDLSSLREDTPYTYRTRNRATDKDELEYVVVENDHLTAINSNIERSYEKYICVDVPIKSNSLNLHGPVGSSFEVRFKSETPVVVSGPNKGKYVVKPSDSDGSNFMTEDMLVEDDIVLPAPTGTRDVLESSEGFSDWLTEEFYRENYVNNAEILREVETVCDYYNLSLEHKKEFESRIREVAGGKRRMTRAVIDKAERRMDTKFTPELKENLSEVWRKSVSLAPEDTSGVSRKQNREIVSVRDLLHYTRDSVEDVYMAHRITQERAEFVWAAENSHKVVRIPSSDQDRYEKKFGWKRLNSLDFAEDLEMDEETRSKFTEDEDNSIENTEITLHIGSYSNTEKVSVNDLKNRLSSDDSEISTLVIFKRGRTSVSDNDQMVGENVGTASVTGDVFDYLISHNSVISGKEEINRDIILTASNGETYNIKEETIPKNIMVHVVPKEAENTFKDESVMENIDSHLNEQSSVRERLVYLPMTKKEAQISGVDRGWGEGEVNIGEGYERKREYYSETLTQFYAETQLGNSPVENALKQTCADWNRGGKELIETITKLDI